MIINGYDLRIDAKESAAVYSCEPRQAVIAAYAQLEKKDFNTWGYESRYGALVQEGRATIACGDYCARKENQ